VIGDLYSGAPVKVDVARQQWAEGHRRLEEARPDGARYERLLAQVEVVTAELRRRIGQTFSLAELAALYDASDAWARDAVEAADPAPGATNDLATVGDAAFHLYARGATDYAP
jgi:hypothetical protein